MDYYPKLERTNMDRIYNLGKENGFCIITAFEKPYKTEIPYKVNLIMEIYKDNNERMYERLVKSGYMFLPVYGIYKGTYDAISYFVINKKKKTVPETIADKIDFTTVLNMGVVTYRFFTPKITYTMEDKDKITVHSINNNRKMLLPSTFTELIELFYQELEAGYTEAQKEPGTFQYYLKTLDTIPGMMCQEHNTGILLKYDELPKEKDGWM